jgi:hypothetical protein
MAVGALSWELLVQGKNGKVKAMLTAGNAYFIPPYQRSYEWGAERWQGLIQDVMEATTRDRSHPAHWLGVLLLSDESPTHNPIDDSKSSLLTVIDGQQRLVTLAIWLTALCDFADDTGQDPGFDADNLSKILVQASDRKSFEVVRSGGWRDPKHFSLLDQRPLEAYLYFRWILWLGDAALLSAVAIKPPNVPKAPVPAWENYWTQEIRKKAVAERLAATGIGDREDLHVSAADLVSATRERLTVFSMVHEGETDESQAVIFEALNGMRTELEPLDHVRNSLFVRIDGVAAQELYERFWSPIELVLRKVTIKRMSPGTIFLYDYLISRGESRNQGPINARRAASHFAHMTQPSVVPADSLADFVKEDVLLAMAAWPCVIGWSPSFEHDGVCTQPNNRNRDLMRSIRTLSENPANPLVLHYLMALARGNLSQTGLQRLLHAIEGFLVRQLLAGRPFSPLRSRIMEVMAHLHPSTDYDDLVEALGGADGSGWPSDRDIKKVMATRPLYGDAKPSQLGALLRGIERQMSGSGALVFWIGRGDGYYTIEHIYPQEPAQGWSDDFATWRVEEPQARSRVNCLGNLTVATQEFNSGMGNLTLREKQNYSKKLGKAAPLNLHAGWLNEERWGSAEIDERGAVLLKAALSYWAHPHA